MKTVRFIFVMMIAAGVLPGAGFAAHASSAPQAISQSSDKSVEQQKDEIRNDNDKDQAHPKDTDENQKQSVDMTRTTTKHRSSAGHSTLVPSHQVRPAKMPTNGNTRTDAPKSINPPEQTGSKTTTTIPNQAVNRRSPSAPSSSVSVNGQQFKNSHDPGARLAVSGGSLMSPRGAAAINGTNMKRKP
jgi:hypothetical protein